MLKIKKRTCINLVPKCVVNELGTSDYREADTGLSKRGGFRSDLVRKVGGGGRRGCCRGIAKTRSRSCYLKPGAGDAT